MKHTAKYISLILLGLILINIFSLALLKVHYELNKDFITENYCINIDKPELNCDGQCHLDELLKIVSNDNHQNTEIPSGYNLNLISIEFFFSEITYLPSMEIENIKSESRYLNNYTFLNTFCLERPPIG